MVRIGRVETQAMTPHLSQALDFLSGNDTVTHALLVLGVALITTSLLMRYRKRRTKSRVADSVTPQEQIERVRQQRGMRGDLEDLMVEIEQLAKRFSAQLDAKSMELERLLEHADRSIARLERLRGDEAGDSRMGGGGGQADGYGGVPQAGVGVGEAGGGNDALARSVYTLADQGLGPGEIAEKLGELVGKIELILALRSA